MMRTYRLIEPVPTGESVQPERVAIDVVLRAHNEKALGNVELQVRHWLDSEFLGDWVDRGTDREEYTLAEYGEY